MEEKKVSQRILSRLPIYIDYLKSISIEENEFISSGKIAEELGLGEVQVRKDLASVCKSGKPKLGYSTEELIDTLETFLGYKDMENAIVVGAGKLGGALLSYEGFNQYGLNVVMGFDMKSEASDSYVINKKIMHVSFLENYCKEFNIKIGIITTPSENAQLVCDKMVESGILAIMNFAPIYLKAPENILIQNINIASKLALLRVNLYRKESS